MSIFGLSTTTHRKLREPLAHIHSLEPNRKCTARHSNSELFQISPPTHMTCNTYTPPRAVKPSITSSYSFPRTAAAAGSFWNYVSSVDSKSSDFQTSYTAANDRLIVREIFSSSFCFSLILAFVSFIHLLQFHRSYACK